MLRVIKSSKRTDERVELAKEGGVGRRPTIASNQREASLCLVRCC